MAFCRNCGKRLDGDCIYCPACGVRQEGAPAPSEMSPVSDIEHNKLMAVLAYLGPLVFVPIFAARQSPFARYHANQGLTLLAVWVANWIVFALLGLIRVSKTLFMFGVAYQTIKTTPVFIGVLHWLVSAAITVLAIIGIINAAGGRTKPLPIIGSFGFLDRLFK